MTRIAPIGPVRLPGIAPVRPPADDDVRVDTTSLVSADYAATSVRVDAVHDLVAAGFDPRRRVGNAAIETMFDPRLATNVGDAPRGTFATPLARALASSAQR